MSRHSFFHFFFFLGVAVSLFVGGGKSSVNGRRNRKKYRKKKEKASKNVYVSINKKSMNEEEESWNNVVVGVISSCLVVVLCYASYEGYKYMRTENAPIINSGNSASSREGAMSFSQNMSNNDGRFGSANNVLGLHDIHQVEDLESKNEVVGQKNDSSIEVMSRPSDEGGNQSNGSDPSLSEEEEYG